MRALCLVVVGACAAAPTLAAPAKAASSTKAKPAKPAKAPPKPRPPVVAVLPFGGVVDDALRARLAAQVRNAAAPYGFVVDDAAKTEALIKDVLALGLACDDNSIDCMVRVGALGGAQTVLAGVLSPEDGGTRLELVAVDVGAVRERSRVRVRIAADGGEAAEAAAVASALIGTFRPDEWRGQLRVQVAQRGASVYVDGVPRGFAPLSSTLELPPGPHQLFVGLEGFRAHKSTVEVVYGDQTIADVVLVPGESEAPPVFSSTSTTTAPAAPAAPTAPTEPRKKKGPQRVVFYDVEATGVPLRTARVVGALLTAELRKREGVSVLDSSELRALVGDGKGAPSDLRTCNVEQCFAEVAEALGADGVVVAQLTRVEGTVLFGLRRIDQQKQEVVASFVERASADDDAALLPLVGQSIAATFGEFPVRAGQAVGVDDGALRVLRPPPVSATVTNTLTVGAAAFGVTAVGFGVALAVGAIGHEVKLQSVVAADVRKPSDHDDIAAYTTTAIVGAWGTGIAVVVAGALGGTALALSGSTDWENNAQRFGGGP